MGDGGQGAHSEGSGVRLRLLGAANAGDGSSAYTVYRVRVEGGSGDAQAHTSKRFSSFLDLLVRLGKEAGAGGERGSVAAGVVDNWKRQLTLEKRHTGKASRAEAVVNGRLALLQRMLDEITAVPELANSVALMLFLADEQ
jgi:hypothetical protein